MLGRNGQLLAGAALVAFAVSALAAALSQDIVFAYAVVVGFIAGSVSMKMPRSLQGAVGYHDSLYPPRVNTVLAVTDSVLITGLLLRLALGLQFPTPVYAVGAVLLIISAASRLQLVFRP